MAENQGRKEDVQKFCCALLGMAITIPETLERIVPPLHALGVSPQVDVMTAVLSSLASEKKKVSLDVVAWE